MVQQLLATLQHCKGYIKPDNCFFKVGDTIQCSSEFLNLCFLQIDIRASIGPEKEKVAVVFSKLYKTKESQTERW
jgi:hypothetical protein